MNQGRIHQIVVSIVIRDIIKRSATITMSIGTIATVKETIKPKNAEILVGQMNTDALEIGFKENGLREGAQMLSVMKKRNGKIMSIAQIIV